VGFICGRSGSGLPLALAVPLPPPVRSRRVAPDLVHSISLGVGEPPPPATSLPGRVRLPCSSLAGSPPPPAPASLPGCSRLRRIFPHGPTLPRNVALRKQWVAVVVNSRPPASCRSAASPAPTPNVRRPPTARDVGVGSAPKARGRARQVHNRTNAGPIPRRSNAGTSPGEPSTPSPSSHRGGCVPIATAARIGPATPAATRAMPHGPTRTRR
jgi:hypothetical protein